MLFAVDIGNTNIAIGLFEDENLVYTARLHTEKKKTAMEYAMDLHNISGMQHWDNRALTGVAISSVVPEITGVFSHAVEIFCGLTPLVLGPGVKNGLLIRIDNPAQLGADLVAGAVAAKEKYPMPCVILDLGTATKLSVLDKNGTFQGCAICPGVRVALEALSASASQLTSIGFHVSDCEPFGKNTITSMQAGSIVGTAAMLDGMCGRIEEKLGEPIRTVIATGGFAAAIAPYIRREHICVPGLLLDGLRIIYEKNNPDKK